MTSATPSPTTTPLPKMGIYERNARLGRGINLGNAPEAPKEGEWGVTLESQDLPFQFTHQGAEWVHGYKEAMRGWAPSGLATQTTQALLPSISRSWRSGLRKMTASFSWENLAHTPKEISRISQALDCLCRAPGRRTPVQLGIRGVSIGIWRLQPRHKTMERNVA